MKIFENIKGPAALIKLLGKKLLGEIKSFFFLTTILSSRWYKGKKIQRSIHIFFKQAEHSWWGAKVWASHDFFQKISLYNSRTFLGGGGGALFWTILDSE